MPSSPTKLTMTAEMVEVVVAAEVVVVLVVAVVVAALAVAAVVESNVLLSGGRVKEAAFRWWS